MTNHRLFVSLVFLALNLPQPAWPTDWPTFNLLEANSSNTAKSQTVKVSHDTRALLPGLAEKRSG